MTFSVNKELKRNYDTYYDGVSEWRYLGAKDRANNIVALCGDIKYSCILEIGSGDGSILKELSDKQFGDKFYSLEISESAVDVINKRKISKLISCKLFDGYVIPYNDNEFDLVVLSHVVEHLEYPRKLLYEAARVAKHVFIEVPCEDNLGLSMNYVDDGVGHINYYTPKTIRRLVQTSNLVVSAQNITIPSYEVYKYIHKNKYNALLRYLIKKVMLLLFSDISTNIFTYHSSLLCIKKIQ